MGEWWRWALVSPDGVAPSRMVGVSAYVNLPCTMKSRNSLLAPAQLGGPGKRAVKWLWWWWSLLLFQKRTFGGKRHALSTMSKTDYIRGHHLSSNIHHWSNDDCLESKRENYQVCSVQCCVQQLCTVHCTHI